MTPNQISFVRVLLALLAIALFEINPLAGTIAVALTIIAVTLDAVDGYVARKKLMDTALGATVDILGDRMVENIYLIYFASAGIISFWIPIAFILRGMATDFIRALASLRGKSGFGKNSMMETPWGRAWVTSRWSRGLYGAVKCAAFCVLGLLLSVKGWLEGAPESVPSVRVLEWCGMGLAYLTLALCLLRGIPVLWEGWRYTRLDKNFSALSAPLR